MARIHSGPRYDLIALGSFAFIGTILCYYVLGEGNNLNLGKLITPITGDGGGIKLTTPPVEDPTRGMDRGFTPAGGSVSDVESYPISQDPFGNIMYTTVEVINGNGLSQKEIDEIVASAQSGFGAGMSREEIIEHLHGEVRVARDETGKIIAFLTTTHEGPNAAMNTDTFVEKTGDRALYIKGVAVHASAKGHGIATALIEDALKDFRAEGGNTISVRAQNGDVARAIEHALAKLQHDGVISGYHLDQQALFKGLYGRQLAEVTPRPLYGTDYRAGDAKGLVYKIR